jgi:hypothetical protein
LTIWVSGLITFAVAGAYVATLADLPVMWSSGAVVGVGLGVVAVAAFLHLLESTPGRRPSAGLRR